MGEEILKTGPSVTRIIERAIAEALTRNDVHPTSALSGANVDAFAQGVNLGVPMANSVRYDPANYRGVYASLAKSTNLLSADAARAAVDFFKGKAAGIKKL